MGSCSWAWSCKMAEKATCSGTGLFWTGGRTDVIWARQPFVRLQRKENEWVWGGEGGGDNAVLASQHHIPLVLNTLTSFSTSLSTTPARERIHHFSNLICLCSLVYYYYYYLFPRIVTRIFLDFMRQLGRAWGTVRRASFSSLVTAGETFTRHFLLCRGAARASALLSPI